MEQSVTVTVAVVLCACVCGRGGGGKGWDTHGDYLLVVHRNPLLHLRSTEYHVEEVAKHHKVVRVNTQPEVREPDAARGNQPRGRCLGHAQH